MRDEASDITSETRLISIAYSLILYSGRPNVNGADLNRNFPSQFRNGKIGKHIKMSNREIMKLSPSDPSMPNNAYTQPETRSEVHSPECFS